MARGSERRTAILLTAFIGLVTGVATAQVGAGLWRIGVAGEWQWAYYASPAHWSLLGPVLVSGAVLVGLAAYGLVRRAPSRLFITGLLIAMVLAALGLYTCMDELGPLGSVREEAYVTVAPWVGGYYLESLRVGSLPEFLATYDDYIAPIPVNDKFLGHISDHPPGPVVLHVLLNRLLGGLPPLAELFYPGEAMHRDIERNLARRPLARHEVAGVGAAAMLFRLLAALTLVPVYLLGRAAYSHRTGMMAAGLSALIPALHVFGPYVDQVQPVMAVTVLWLFWRSTQSRRGGWAWSVAAGVVLFLGLQITLAFLTLVFTMGVAAGLMLAGQLHGRKRDGAEGKPPTAEDRPPAPGELLTRWGLLALAGALGVLVPALASFLILDYDVVSVWWICFSKHATFAETFHRTYWKWTLFGPVEVALFVGLPVGCLALWRVGRRGWGWISGVARRRPMDVFLWALFATAVALNVSGKNLGEVARLWMFLMPPVAVVAAAELDTQERPVGGFITVAGLTLFQAVVFCAVLNVFSA